MSRRARSLPNFCPNSRRAGSRLACLSLLGILALSAGCVQQRPHDTAPGKESATQPATSSIRPNFSADAVTVLKIKCGMGPVRIVGDDQIKSIPDEALIYIERRGDSAMIEFNTMDLENPKLVLPEAKPTGSGQTFTGDATFRVPPGARLIVFNEGGNLVVSGMRQSTRVLNHGDDVQLRNLKGSVDLATFGKVAEVRGVTGPVQVRDALGAITVLEITGDVTVNDQGGPMSVFTVTGNVTAANATNSAPADFPGRPKINNIEGDVTLVKIAAELSQIEGLTGQIRHQQ